MAAFTSGGEDWQPLYRFLKDALSVNVNVNIADAVGSYFTDMAAALNNMTVQMASSQQALQDAISKISDTFGTIETIDRNGKIFYADGFESGMGAFSFSLSGSSEMWVTRRSRKSGLQSLNMNFDADYDDASLTKYFPLPQAQHLGFEFSIHHPAYGINWSMNTMVTNGVTNYMVQLSLNMDTGDLVLLTDGGDVTIRNLSLAPYFGNGWSTFKFTLDQSTGKYHHAYVNGQLIDLSAYAPISWTYDEYYILFTITFAANAGVASNTDVFLDDIIITEEA